MRLKIEQNERRSKCSIFHAARGTIFTHEPVRCSRTIQGYAPLGGAPVFRPDSMLSFYSLFDIDAKGSEIKRGKPHPDIFLRATKLLKLQPYNCVVFEDAQAGIDAAKKAGMICVGVIRNKNKLKNADILIKDFSEINFNKIKCLFEKK